MENTRSDKNLLRVFKAFTFLFADVKFCFFLFSFIRLITCTFFLGTTLLCLQENEERKDEYISKVHDALILFSFMVLELCFIASKAKWKRILEIIEEQLNEQDAMNIKLLKIYKKEIYFYCVFLTPFCLLGTLMWSLVLLFSSINSFDDGKCVHLVAGWVRNSDSYVVLLSLNLTGDMIIHLSCLQWFLLFYCMVASIKHNIRTLYIQLDGINKAITTVEFSLMDPKNHRISLKHKEVLGESKGPTSKVADLKLLKSNGCNGNLLYLKMLNRESIMSTKIWLKKFNEYHLRAIKYFHLTEEIFRLSFLLSTQIGVIVVALALPKLNLNETLLKPFVLQKGIEVLEVLGIVGLLSFLRQTLLNESKSLRQALYNCDWTDKPYSLRRGLLIMQIMASKPLRLTIGGMYTLGLETYANVLQAA